MMAPELFDVWNIGHALVGLAMGTLQLKRWFAYPLKIAWEIYQLFIHYQPYNLGLKDIWANSILDTVIFALVYELTLPCARLIARTDWWRRIPSNAKYIMAFLMLNFGGAFVMGWDLKPSIIPALPQISTVVFPLVWCPAISAILVRSLISKEGFADAGLALNLKQKWPYYLTVGILPAIFAAVISYIFSVSYSGLPTWLHTPFFIDMTGTAISTLLSCLVLTVQLVILTLIMAVIMFGQEFGWRGYLEPLLFSRHRLLSSVFTGIIWGLWLVPVTWRAYRLSGSAASGLLLIPLVTICLSIILGWLRIKTGNIWMPSLLHGAVATIGGSLIVAPVYVNAQTVSVSPLGICIMIPLLFFSIWILFAGFRARR